MTAQQAITVRRTSWQYRVLGWFYKREEGFPKTTCGVAASVIMQPVGYIASCLTLLLLAIISILMAGMMPYMHTQGGLTVATGTVVLIGLGALNLLFLALTFVQPRLWRCYGCLGLIITSWILIGLNVMRKGFSQGLLLPGMGGLIVGGTILGLYLAALLTTKWWLPLFQRVRVAVCKPVEYL